MSSCGDGSTCVPRQNFALKNDRYTTLTKPGSMPATQEENVWEDEIVTTREDAFRQGLTTGLRAPSGKSGRLILLYTSTKGTADCHKEMDGPRFEKWLNEQLLLNIKPPSVIVMDNAPYHSVLLKKIPKSPTRKSDIQSP
ncbi:hypothetical protein HPB49_015542 [Dermacentor silvarum]|uniref:Uncharacterized protein n=1 Tax=Dermacentor silvarum TaxID=543639 RepID=A0ACB8DEH5_DERSI|nr:hypothetical protein HPB49_015542 [Dermacentor silvarum]